MIGALVSWLLTYLLHSTIVLGPAFVLVRVVRRDAIRELLLKVALAGALVTSTVQALSPIDPFSGRLRWTPPPAEAVGERADVRVVVRHVPGQPPVVERRVTMQSAAHRPVMSYAPAVIVLAWLAGATIALARLLTRRRRLTSLLACRRPVADPRVLDLLLRGRSDVRVSISDTLSGPITIGGGEVCLPARALTELTDEQLRAIGAHELAHLEHGDARWLTFSALLETLVPFQPFHRMVRIALIEQMELRCDAVATARTGNPVALARSLADVASWIAVEPLPPGAPAMVERGGSLFVRRVERLLDAAPPDVRRAPGWLLAAALAVLVGVSVLIPAVLVGARDSNEPVVLEKEVELIR